MGLLQPSRQENGEKYVPGSKDSLLNHMLSSTDILGIVIAERFDCPGNDRRFAAAGPERC
jgi:hypothetical protein